MNSKPLHKDNDEIQDLIHLFKTKFTGQLAKLMTMKKILKSRFE